MCVITAVVQYLLCGDHLQRFAEDQLIVSDMVYLDDAPKDEDDRPWEKGALEMVGRAV